MSMNRGHGLDSEGNIQNERGEKPQQEISVVRISADYQPPHASSRPEELAIKVSAIDVPLRSSLSFGQHLYKFFPCVFRT